MLVFILPLWACVLFQALGAWFSPLSVVIFSSWVMKGPLPRLFRLISVRPHADLLWSFLNWLSVISKDHEVFVGSSLMFHSVLSEETKFGTIEATPAITWQSQALTSIYLLLLRLHMAFPSAQLNTVASCLALWWWWAHFRTLWVLL